MPKNSKTRNGHRNPKLHGEAAAAVPERREEIEQFEQWRRSVGLSLEQAARLWAERSSGCEANPSPPGTRD